jgi:hypothetical protein
VSDTQYSNGPLPDFLAQDAYVTAESNEFALNVAEAKQYLDWCRRKNLTVLGLETWRLNESGHDAIEGAVCEGNANACKAFLDEAAQKHGEDVVFSVWVEMG